MKKSCRILKNKKFPVIFITLLLILFIFILYLLESRFFLIGRALYPVYRYANNAIITRSSQADTIVYCDYYTWHNKANWLRGYSEEPELGLYDSLDPAVIDRHIHWAQEYGIDVFKIEYYPQLDDSILNGIFAADTGDVSLCLMYDSRLRFENIGYPKPPYNFDEPAIQETFRQDMIHIADNYFSYKNYFRIDNRPVLWIYVARDFTGAYKEILSDVRQELLKKGYDVYLVGDTVFWNYKLSMINAFDAVSCYSAYGGRPRNTARFAERLKFLYMVWEISARLSDTDFIPSAIPGYDDRCLESERPSLPVLSGTGEDFKRQLDIIKAFLDPVNISPDISQVSIATFNEHQEGTSVEPSLPWGCERIKQISSVFGCN